MKFFGDIYRAQRKLTRRKHTTEKIKTNKKNSRGDDALEIDAQKDVKKLNCNLWIIKFIVANVKIFI